MVKRIRIIANWYQLCRFAKFFMQTFKINKQLSDNYKFLNSISWIVIIVVRCTIGMKTVHAY